MPPLRSPGIPVERGRLSPIRRTADGRRMPPRAPGRRVRSRPQPVHVLPRVRQRPLRPGPGAGGLKAQVVRMGVSQGKGAGEGDADRGASRNVPRGPAAGGGGGQSRWRCGRCPAHQQRVPEAGAGAARHGAGGAARRTGSTLRGVGEAPTGAARLGLGRAVPRGDLGLMVGLRSPGGRGAGGVLKVLDLGREVVHGGVELQLRFLHRHPRVSQTVVRGAGARRTPGGPRDEGPGRGRRLDGAGGARDVGPEGQKDRRKGEAAARAIHATPRKPLVQKARRRVCVCVCVGIYGQVAVSALGLSCACPTAFITFCPSWRLQRIQFHRHVQPAPFWGVGG